MPYVLGIDLGASDTAAAVCPLDASTPATPRVLALGDRSDTVASVLQVRADGSVTAGSAVGHSGSPAVGVAGGFVARVGDEVPQFVGGRPYLAHDLAAALAAWVLDRATAVLGTVPQRAVLTHPTGWGPHRLAVLRQALHRHGLGDLTLVPAPIAAAHAVPAPAGRPLAVLDLGADPLEAVVVRPRPGGGYELVGRVERVEALLTDDLPADAGHAEPWLRPPVDALARAVGSPPGTPGVGPPGAAGPAGAPGVVLVAGRSGHSPALADLAGARLGWRPLVGPDLEHAVAMGAALVALGQVRPAAGPPVPWPGNVVPDAAAAGVAEGALDSGPAAGRGAVPAGHGSGPPVASSGPPVARRSGPPAAPPRPPVDIEPPDLEPPRSLVRQVAGRPLVLAAMGLVGVVGVALTLALLPSDVNDGSTPSRTTPPAAGVPQPGTTDGPGR